MMKYMAINLGLAAAWCFLFNRFDWPMFLAGFAVGLGLLRLAGPWRKPTDYFRRMTRGVRYAGFFTKELILANLQIARIVLSPTITVRPALIAYPSRCKTDLETTSLANSITLTPGTLVVDLSPDHKILYVHAMSGEDKAAVIASIQKGLEDPLLEIFE